MRETWIIAVHYFQRIARKPLLVLFMLAIPFTLLLAEFAAFGRVPSTNVIGPAPVKVLITTKSATSDQYVHCLSEQPDRPLAVEVVDDSITPQKGTALVRISETSPMRVRLEKASDDPADSVLALSILRLCASETSQVVAPGNSLMIERPASTSGSSALGGSHFFARFFPGLALFGALFLAQAMASLIWRDRERTVNKRLLSSPIDPSSLVLGPLVFLMAGATFSLVLILGLCALATSPQAFASTAFWALILGFGLCAAGLQMTIGLLAGNQRAAHAMSSSTVMMLAFFGGGFVPLSIYPPMLRAVAYLLPNGSGQAGLTEVLEGVRISPELLGHVAIVWVWAAILVMAAITLQVRRMRT